VVAVLVVDVVLLLMNVATMGQVVQLLGQQ
jgi:hypothetical protein